MLTMMHPHINHTRSDPGHIESPLNDSIRRAHEGVDGAIGGWAGVHVQQVTPFRVDDGVSDGIDHLKPNKEQEREIPTRGGFTNRIKAILVSFFVSMPY